MSDGVCGCGRTSLPATATAMATNSTLWACVAVVRDADADGICDDVDDCVGTLDELAFATGPVRFTSADVATSPRRLRLRRQPA